MARDNQDRSVPDSWRKTLERWDSSAAECGSQPCANAEAGCDHLAQRTVWANDGLCPVCADQAGTS